MHVECMLNAVYLLGFYFTGDLLLIDTKISGLRP